MNKMMYKNYSARIDYDEVDEIFVGQLAGIRDIISFDGSTVTELKLAFEEAVDHYLMVCKQRKEAPQKPFSGNLMLRVSPDVHAAVVTAANLQGKSINQWAGDILNKAASG